MNYRHAYHAGNFADVLKHAVLALIISYLKKKDAPFRVIDTHAGCGLYALDSVEAGKTREWEGGIGKLLGADAAPLSPEAAQALAPYLDAVRAENPQGRLVHYPGSPLIARRLLRQQDRLIANELHPVDGIHLKQALGRDPRAKVLALDGWVALKSLLPPKERRAIVLIDPPFEKDDELERMADGLAAGLHRFSTGVFAAWLPIKDRKPVSRFYERLRPLASVHDTLRMELLVRDRGGSAQRLIGCAMIVVNPPFELERQLTVILPELAARLGGASGLAQVGRVA
jgi:23S rRNA (adenine2030-N6)-methyltransferase